MWYLWVFKGYGLRDVMGVFKWLWLRAVMGI